MQPKSSEPFSQQPLPKQVQAPHTIQGAYKLSEDFAKPYFHKY